jgi:hypothetical protein
MNIVLAPLARGLIRPWRFVVRRLLLAVLVRRVVGYLAVLQVGSHLQCSGRKRPRYPNTD